MHIYMATRPRGFTLVLVPVYFIKHSVSCYIYYKEVYSNPHTTTVATLWIIHTVLVHCKLTHQKRNKAYCQRAQE